MRRAMIQLLAAAALFYVAGLAYAAEPSSEETSITFCGQSCHDNNFAANGRSSKLANFTSTAVACDAPLCSTISKSILEMGGAIADAAIAGMLCMGVVHPHNSGIGGGLVAIYYNAQTQESTVLSGRERAPLAANESMFDNLPPDSSYAGSLALAVPGEMKGFVELYTRFGGKVPWRDLFLPSIDLLENGVKVDSLLAAALRSSAAYIRNDTSLRSVFFNETTDSVLTEGNIMKNPVLAQTLRTIAEQGGQAFYDSESTLAQTIVQDLVERGAIITAEDFNSFIVQVQNPVAVNFEGDLTLFTAGPPSSGGSTAFVLRLVEKFKSNLTTNDPLSSHVLVEAWKMAYGRRDQFGDPDDPVYGTGINDHLLNLIQNENYLLQTLDKIKPDWTSNDETYYQDGTKGHGPAIGGTAHFAIVGANGDAISATTTVGNHFGAKVRSPNTGVIFNNKMYNFVQDPVDRVEIPANKIGPGKRAMSTASPSIFTDANGEVRLVIGGAGGMKIITAVTSSVINHLWLGQNIEEAISATRIHHALYPMLIDYEPGYNQAVLDTLETYGHVVKEGKADASVVGISRDDSGQLWATWDPRRPGSVDGI